MNVKGMERYLLRMWILCLLAGVTVAGVAQTPRFDGVRAEGGAIIVRFSGIDPAVNARLDGSTDLVEWKPLATFAAGATAGEYSDSTAPWLPFRYYRVTQLSTAGALSGDHLPTADGDVVVHPVNHATLVLGWKDRVIHVDPVGGSARFQGLPRPTLVLVTDVHGDHLDSPTLNAIGAVEADIVAPQAVFQMLSSGLRAKTRVLANGASIELQGMRIEAVPMYNTTPARLSYHSKGRGNGYVVTMGGRRFYVSGDTEDIPEMRALREIDAAFVCMNLPFTMTVDQAAGAVREFRPRIVYPYHFSSSDVARFKTLVGLEPGVEVRLRKWY